MSRRRLRANLLVFVAAIGVGAPACGRPEADPAGETPRVPVRLVSVVDGDTLVIELPGGNESVRLIGVDTPELARGGLPEELGAGPARDFVLRETGSRRVALSTDVGREDRDDYGRLLRYVYLEDGRLLNAELVRRGYGYALTRYPFEKAEAFRRDERQAREEGRGLWEETAVAELRRSFRRDREPFHVFPSVDHAWVVRYGSRAKTRIPQQELERELAALRTRLGRLEGEALEAELSAAGYGRLR